MKHILAQMAKPPEELPMYLKNVGKLFTMYEVPEEHEGKLLLPLLTTARVC